MYKLLLLLTINFTLVAEEAKPCCQSLPVNSNVNTITVNQRSAGSLIKTVPVYNSNVSKSNTYIKETVQVVKVPEIKVIKLKRTITKTKIKKVPVVRTKVRTVTRTKTEKAAGNYIGVVGGVSKTKLKEEVIQNNKKEIKPSHELDLGLEYKYLFKNGLGVGIQGTMQENYYLTIGVNF